MLSPSGAVGRESRRRLVLTASCCALLALLPIWAFPFLPMVDLPQHAAQAAIALHWDEPAYAYPQHFVSNWRTPYLFPNSLVLLVAQVLPIPVAFQLLLSLAILGVPLAAWRLLRESGGDPWWAFGCFPLAFGFSFYWGFFNFVLGTPLVLLFLLLATRYAAFPTRRRAIALFLLLELTFALHPILFGLCGLMGASVVLLQSPSLRMALRRLLPLIAALPLALAWLVATGTAEGEVREPAVWALGLRRVPQLVALTVGFPIGAMALVCGMLFLLFPFFLGARPSRRAYRWAPLGVVLVLYLFSPHRCMGTSLVYQRFAGFLLPTLLFALDPGAVPRPRWRAVPPLLACAWLASLGLRFWGFNMEMAGLPQVVEGLQPQRRVLYVAADRASEFIPYPVFVYSGIWYQIRKGGMVDWSFAEWFAVRFRYRPESKPRLPPLFRWQPWRFRWSEHGGALFDYYIVRSPVDLERPLFAGATSPIVLERREGSWWVYRRGLRHPTSSWVTVPAGRANMSAYPTSQATPERGR